MKFFFHFELAYDIYICVNNNEAYITVPAYDVFNQKCYSSIVDSRHIKFHYYNYIFEYKDSEIKNQLIIFNIQEKKRWIQEIRIIQEQEFLKNSKKIDRKKLLKEKYQNKRIFFKDMITYKVINSYKYISEFTVLYNNEIEYVHEIIKWFFKYFHHVSKDIYPYYGRCCDIFSEAILKNGAMNCKNMAIVLNAIFLSLGIKSRYIQCLQLERKVDNCHFVVEVYISEIKKWILVDSSYALMFKNVYGDYLSLRELRDILSNEGEVNLECLVKPISKLLYLRSFVKKIYRFRRAFASTDCFFEDDKLIELCPSCEELEDNYKITYTDSPDCFWEK